MRRLLIVLLLIAGLGVVARGAVPCAALSFQPACYVQLLPGPAENTLDIVEIDGARTYTPAGKFLLTTVAVETDLDVLEWLRGALSDRTQEVPRTRLFPPGHDEEEVFDANEALMANSQLEATIAALRALDYEFDTDYDGAQIHAIAEVSSVTDGAIEAGDVVVAVDGEPVRTNSDLVELVSAHDPGDTVVLDVVRDGRDREVAVTLVESPEEPGKPLLGVTVTSYLELPVEVAIDAGRIGGPSAGLMFSVSIVDLLGPEDLTGGVVVAGTGEIDRDGRVGPIGGIQQKVIGATTPTEDHEAATVFLTPRANLAEAQRAAVDRDVLLVPVDTLADALDALRALREGREPAGALALSAR